MRLDDFPHTSYNGAMEIYKNQIIFLQQRLGTNGARLLSKTLKANPNLKFYFKQSCNNLEDVLSYNVVGEITGIEHPRNNIVVGGHLDS
jgi:hypothetical protein